MAYLFPIPVVVVGCRLKDIINWITIAYVGIISSQHISLSMDQTHFSNTIIKKTRQVSINIPSVEDMELTDRIGCISGKDADKSDMVEYFYGELLNAPLISGFPINLECEVTEILQYGHNDLFICTPKNIYASPSVIDRKTHQPIVSSTNPLLFSWDGYYEVHRRVGTPWKESLIKHHANHHKDPII